MSNVKVAETILEQLGGGRFIAMTGARGLVGSETGLSFSLPASVYNKRRINRVTVTLTPTDVYDVRFMFVSRKGIALVESATGLYNDQLQETFTRVTGLRTRL